MNEGELRRFLSSRLLPEASHAWDDAWRATAKGPINLAVDSAFLVEVLEPAINGPGAPQLGMFSPLWIKSHSHAMSLNVSKGITFDYVAMGNSDEGANQTAKTLDALLTLGNNALPEWKAKAQNQGGPMAAAAILAIAESILHAAKVERSGQTVHVSAAIRSHIFGQSSTSSRVVPAGDCGMPERWLIAWRTNTPSLPFWANSGQYVAIGSSYESRPRSARKM